MQAQFKASKEKLGGGIGDATGLSWSINYLGVVAGQQFCVSADEKNVLRDLAQKVAEISAQPIQQVKISLWKRHHALQQTRPLVFCDPEGAWYELIRAEDLVCHNMLARIWEFKLRKELFWAEHIKDDRVVEPALSVHTIYRKTLRGLDAKIVGGKAGGAYNWESPLKDGYERLADLKPSRVEVEMDRMRKLLAIAHDVFDGILEIRLEGVWWWSLGMTTDLIYLRGFENVLYDFYDYPDEVHRLMTFLRDENLAMLDMLEKQNLLTLNNSGDYHGTGGYAWTDELPQPGFDGHVRTMDMWGFCESQETVGVSPQLFEEFIFPYQLSLLERFGLNIYGCCEPLDARWDIVKRIPRLRKVTVSPWSDDEVMAEQLSDKYVYCKKVNPALISTAAIDEGAIRKELRKAFDSAKRYDCRVEVLMRDVMTLACNPQNAVRWVQLAREEAER
jgi:hypothetical protein